MKLSMKKVVDVEAKALSISAKCSDLCIATLKDQDGQTIHETDGYVPSFMPNGGGDYVNIDIDLETGRILNWVKPDLSEVQKWMEVDE